MTGSTNEVKLDSRVWKNSLKTTAKILAIALVAVFYVFSTLFFISPDFSAKIYNFMGFKKAEEACYIEKYKKDYNIVDLYNLVLFEQRAGNTKSELEYLQILMASDEYEAFCEKLDNSSILNCESKSMIAVVGDVNAYLVNRKVKCLYELNQSAETTVLNSLNAGELSEYAFATYVELIKNSELTLAEKVEKYNTLLETTKLGANGQVLVVDELLEDRLSKLDREIAENTNGTKKLILTYTQMKLSYAGYNVYVQLNQNEKANGYKTIYEAASDRYLDIIK